MKVYVLSIGEYSAYEILAIFDEQHLPQAREAAKLLRGRLEGDPEDEYESQPPDGWFELNKLDLETPPAGKRFYSLQMTKHGKVSFINEWTVLSQGGRDESVGSLQRQCWDVESAENNPITKRFFGKHHWRLNLQVYADDEQHAIKIASELKFQIIAGAKPLEGSLDASPT